MDVVEALRAHGEVGAQIVDLLYGEAGFEVSKALSDQQRRERTQGRIAAASNVVGIGAGLAAIPGATREFTQKRRALAPATNKGTLKPLSRIGGTKAGAKIGSAAGALGTQLKKPKVALGLAAGGLALQAGNVGGDFVTNRVLARSNKKAGISKGVNDVEWTGEISKVDTDKRQVFGWASVTSVNGVPVKDLQGDEIDLDEIEKAAYNYVISSRKGGNMHQKDSEGNPVHVSDLIESFVVSKSKREQMNLPDSVPEGWWCGFKVNDDATWEDAKNGRLVEFSIHGTGKRV